MPDFSTRSLYANRAHSDLITRLAGVAIEVLMHSNVRRLDVDVTSMAVVIANEKDDPEYHRDAGNNGIEVSYTLCVLRTFHFSLSKQNTQRME